MLLSFINQSVKKFLANDPETAQRLHEFNDKHVVLELIDLNIKTLITIDDGAIILSIFQEDEVNEVHASIHTNVFTLLQIGLGVDYQSMLKNGSLVIKGDADLVNQLRTIFKEFDFDWEEIVAKYFGDSIAYQAGVMAKKLGKYKQRSLNNFRLDVSEYLQEESRIVPTRIELEHFYNAVDNLDADIDRLEARTRRLLVKCEI